MHELKPNAQRAKTAVILIWIVWGIEMISAISDFFQYLLLQDALNGASITLEQADANDNRQLFLFWLLVVVYLISTITFILWFRRAYYNLHTKVSNLSYSEGWAAGAWFVPIMNLFRPYQIMKELYEETNRLLSQKLPGYTQQLTYTAIGWWWGFWITSRIGGRFISNYTKHATTLEEMSNSTMASLIFSAVAIPLSILTIKMIKDYAATEPLIAELKDEDPEATAARLAEESKTFTL